MNTFYSGHPDGRFELASMGEPWLLGDGLFETVKSENGQLFFLDRHLDRLKSSAEELHFDRVNYQQLRLSILDVMDSNAGIDRGRFRITLFSNGEYLLTHQAAPLQMKPLKLKIASTIRYSQSALSGLKSLSYGEAALGLRLAKEAGVDDILYVNERGEVAETSIANILIERRGEFLTPSLGSGCLPGIVRGVLLDWFKGVKEAPLTMEDVKSATGMYVLSSIREIDLVSELHFADGSMQKFQISAEAEKLRADYFINSRSQPNS